MTNPFWQEGTPLTPSNLNTIGAAFFNVKNSAYSAVGNGVADDTSAINAALSAASNFLANTGETPLVYVPAGIYKVTSTVTQARHVRVLMDTGAVINYTPTTGTCWVVGAVSGPSAQAYTPGGVWGGTLQGSGGSTTGLRIGTTGVGAAGFNTLFFGLQVSNFSDNIALGDEAWAVSFIKCASRLGVNGFRVPAGLSGSGAPIGFTECTISGNTNNISYQGGAANILSFTNCTLDNGRIVANGAGIDGAQMNILGGHILAPDAQGDVVVVDAGTNGGIALSLRDVTIEFAANTSFTTAIQVVGPRLFVLDGTNWIVPSSSTVTTGVEVKGTIGTNGAVTIGANSIRNVATPYAITATGGPALQFGPTSAMYLRNVSYAGINGTALQPSYGFTSDASLGLYKSNTSTIAQSYGTFAAPRMSISGDGLAGIGLAFADGYAVRTITPGSTIYIDAGHLIVRDGDSSTTNAGAVLPNSGTALQPTFGFNSEQSLGLYRSGISTLALSYGTFNLRGGILSSIRSTNASATSATLNDGEFRVAAVSTTSAELAYRSGNTTYRFIAAATAL